MDGGVGGGRDDRVGGGGGWLSVHRVEICKSTLKPCSEPNHQSHSLHRGPPDLKECGNKQMVAASPSS